MIGGGDRSVRLGPFELRPERRSLIGDRGEVNLSPLAVRFLLRLHEGGGTIVTRQQLIDDLWDGNFLVGEPALNRLVSETRRAIASTGPGTLIETVQKRGYRLSPASTVSKPGPVMAAGFEWKWPAAVLTFLLIAGTLYWLMDAAMGLVWLLRNPN